MTNYFFATNELLYWNFNRFYNFWSLFYSQLARGISTPHVDWALSIYCTTMILSCVYIFDSYWTLKLHFPWLIRMKHLPKPHNPTFHGIISPRKYFSLTFMDKTTISNCLTCQNMNNWIIAGNHVNLLVWNIQLLWYRVQKNISSACMKGPLTNVTPDS